MLSNGRDSHVSCSTSSTPADRTNINNKGVNNFLHPRILKGGHILLTQRILDRDVKANSMAEGKLYSNRLFLRRSPSIGRRITSTLSGLDAQQDHKGHAQKPTTTATTTTTSPPARDHPEKDNNDLGCIREDEDYVVVDKIILPLNDLDLLDGDDDVEGEDEDEQLNTAMDHDSNLPVVSSNQKRRVSSE